MRNYRAICFDFDYTIGDSTIPITIGYQKGLTQMGWPAPTVDQVRPTIGMTLANGYTAITGDSDPANQARFFDLFVDTVGQRAMDRGDTTMIAHTTFFPGTVPLLEKLVERDIPVGIVSTKQRATIKAIFDHHKMSHLLTLVIGGEDVTRAKPDPQGLLWAVERLELDKKDVLFCGDTTIDAKTAQAAGVDFCAVLNGTTTREEFLPLPHVHIAPDLFDLAAWLELDWE